MFNNSFFANKFSRTNDTINPAEFKPDKQKYNHNLPIFTGYKKVSECNYALERKPIYR